AYCPIWNARPNHMTGRPGVGSALYGGIVDGAAGFPGRLARGSNRIVVESGSPPLDDTSLWSYLNSAGRSLCPTAADLPGCLSGWSGGEILTLSVGDAVRFGGVPKITDPDNDWGPGNSSL